MNRLLKDLLIFAGGWVVGTVVWPAVSSSLSNAGQGGGGQNYRNWTGGAGQ
jgi:hypothetical protein